MTAPNDAELRTICERILARRTITSELLKNETTSIANGDLTTLVRALLSRLDAEKVTPCSDFLRGAAQQAANALYNIAQSDRALTAREKDSIREVQANLDAGLRSIPAQETRAAIPAKDIHDDVLSTISKYCWRTPENNLVIEDASGLASEVIAICSGQP